MKNKPPTALNNPHLHYKSDLSHCACTVISFSLSLFFSSQTFCVSSEQSYLLLSSPYFGCHVLILFSLDQDIRLFRVVIELSGGESSKLDLLTSGDEVCLSIQQLESLLRCSNKSVSPSLARSAQSDYSHTSSLLSSPSVPLSHSFSFLTHPSILSSESRLLPSASASASPSFPYLFSPPSLLRMSLSIYPSICPLLFITVPRFSRDNLQGLTQLQLTLMLLS